MQGIISDITEIYGASIETYLVDLKGNGPYGRSTVIKVDDCGNVFDVYGRNFVEELKSEFHLQLFYEFVMRRGQRKSRS